MKYFTKQIGKNTYGKDGKRGQAWFTNTITVYITITVYTTIEFATLEEFIRTEKFKKRNSLFTAQ
jgi:hypothetical protein